MIDKRELRIGNWVQGNDSPPLQVTSINESMVSCDNWGFDYQDVFGIELTPDILVKCCLSWENYHDGVIIYKFGVFEFWSQYGSVSLNNDYNKLPKVATAHQLQNLFFALCGQELLINLK